eukprot:14623650-Ditylum_brightwellii.AAC.1
MKSIIQQELLPVREAIERANTRSFEAVRETEQPTHKETVEGDHAESGCELFYNGSFHYVPQNWIFPVCSFLVMLQHWFLTDSCVQAPPPGPHL